MKIVRWSALWGACLLIGGACKKVVDVVSITEVEASRLFADERSAASAVVGIYAKMQETQSLFNGYLTRYTGLYAGELTKTAWTHQVDNAFFNTNLHPADAIMAEIWNGVYFSIYSVNGALEKLEISTTIQPDAQKRLQGELKFLRAMGYFYLLNLYGDLPLPLQTDPGKTAVLPRSPAEEVYRQVVKDLKEAQEWMMLAYPESNGVPSDRIRANSAAAAALLAKTYLFMGDYDNAEKYSSWVIDCGRYQLEENLDSVFVATSKELILGLYPTNTRYNTVEGRIFLASPNKPAFSLTSHVMDKFMANDRRRDQWVKVVDYGTGTAYVPFKYKVYETDQVLEYTVLSRLAECYLIRAEANWGRGQYGLAIQDINLLRKRAQTDLVDTNLGKEELRQLIEDEYLRECFTENGGRWFQVRRLPALNSSAAGNRADEILSALKPAQWKAYKIYWPIPVGEILRSGFIFQNPGY